MGGKIYKILMKTPIGVRHGTMTCEVTGKSISGYLNLLNHSEPYSGKIYENGHCTISGHIVTLMCSMLFDAVGEIFDDSLYLSVRTGRNIFEITGFSATQKEVQT